jgi:AraC-like DNA-binding protein
MPIDIQLSNGESLSFIPGLPSDYHGPLLQGAQRFHCRSNVGYVNMQELLSSQYAIRFYTGRFAKKITASAGIDTGGLYSYFMLKNSVRKTLASIGKIHLRQDQYSFYYTEQTHCKLLPDKESEFRILDVFYSPELIQELVPLFPELQYISDEQSSKLVNERTCWSLPSMIEITHEILNCPFDSGTSRLYFDVKVRELLYHLLEQAYNRKPDTLQFTPWEIARIHQARTILSEHISKKPPSIKRLARQVALNEFKLKAGFRQYFHSGLFEWLLEQKMQKAKELLLETNQPIKEICTLVGYPRTTNFITAFKRRFGMTPGSLRR